MSEIEKLKAEIVDLKAELVKCEKFMDHLHDEWIPECLKILRGEKV